MGFGIEIYKADNSFLISLCSFRMQKYMSKRKEELKIRIN